MVQYMVRIDQDTWNTLFSWMSGTECMLPEGCPVPLQGVAVYVFIVVFIAVMLYWNRHAIIDRGQQLKERIPNPLG